MTAPPPPLDIAQLARLPGFLLRRCNQIFLGLFAQQLGDLDISPVQFGALAIVAQRPGLDQTQLTELLALDRSSVTKCVDRLEARGLLLRQVSPSDRRARQLRLTEAGHSLLAAAWDGVQRTNAQLLAPLGAEGPRLLALLEQLAEALNEASRAPLRIKE